MQVRCDPELSEEEARERRRRRECREEVLGAAEDLGGLRAMMVLLLKQTHLQNDVADAMSSFGWLLAG